MYYLGKPNKINKRDFTNKPATKDFDSRLREPDKYKTELCKNLDSGFCEYGEKCFFAHSVHELRDKSQQASSKSVKCKNFFENGYCLVGNKCQFSHREVCPETAESSPIDPNKKKLAGQASVERALKFIDLEARLY